MKCSKCGTVGDRGQWHFYSNLNPTGVTSYRKCPNCGHLEIFNESEADNNYSGPEPWGLSKFRGKVFKGKKKT